MATDDEKLRLPMLSKFSISIKSPLSCAYTDIISLDPETDSTEGKKSDINLFKRGGMWEKAWKWLLGKLICVTFLKENTFFIPSIVEPFLHPQELWTDVCTAQPRQPWLASQNLWLQISSSRASGATVCAQERLIRHLYKKEYKPEEILKRHGMISWRDKRWEDLQLQKK